MFFSKPSILLREFDTFRSWLASGAPLGSQGPFWRPSLDFASRIFGLGSSPGPFLDAFGTSSVFFSNFLAPSGIIFSKSLDITFVLQADVNLEIYLSLFFLQFDFPRNMVVTSQTEIPKVVSSCYRAGNWEWVKQTLCRTKNHSP